MAMLTSAREIRANRANSVATGLGSYTGDNALFDAGNDLGLKS